MNGPALLLLTSLLAACASNHAPPALILEVKSPTPDQCRVVANGVEKRLNDVIAHVAPKLRAATPVHLNATMNVPYRCVGSVIYQIQKAGFRKIGFIAEPPRAY